MPSTFECEIVQISKIEKHPDADTLGITKVYDYPVIVKLEDWNEGDLAVYFPVEAVLPNVPVFSFMWKNKAQTTEKQRMVRAIRLRGIFSMGLLIPLKKLFVDFPELSKDLLKVGDDVSSMLGVYKYEPPEDTSHGNNMKTRGTSIPHWLLKYTDIENVRKYGKRLNDHEDVVILEKCHGQNGRWVFSTKENQMLVGSHNCIKNPDDAGNWGVVAERYDLESKLRRYPDKVFFGEVYGPVQKGFPYDSKGKLKLAMFDIFDLTTGKYLDWHEVVDICFSLDLPVVPTLYQGPWLGLEVHKHLAEGNSIMANGLHIREGFVVKPLIERCFPQSSRVIFKLHGEGYLLGKKKAK